MSKSSTRRKFLGQAAAAGAALAVWSETSAEATKSANDQLVVAIVGTNGRGQALAGGFAAQPNCSVAYICDVDERAIAKGLEAVGKRPRPWESRIFTAPSTIGPSTPS
jgi:hypothetical protein